MAALKTQGLVALTGMAGGHVGAAGKTCARPFWRNWAYSGLFWPILAYSGLFRIR